MNNLKAKQCDPVGLHPKWNHQQIYSREINEKQKSLGNKKKTLEIVYLLVVSFAPSWDQTSLQNYFFSNNNSDLLWRLAAVEDNDTLCYVVIHDCGQYVFCSNFYFSLLRKGDVFVPVGVVCFHFICNRQSDKTLAAFFLTSALLFLLFCLSLVGVEIIKILLPFLERLCLAIG